MHQFTDIIKQATYSAKLSKLLAQENISVQFDSNAETASFHPQNRTLTLPYTTSMLDNDIQECFMFHEVSHAINLPTDSIEIVKSAGVDHDIFNIVVDIRDERLIKQQYPGCIKTMQIAYEKLLDQEFFGDVEAIPFRSFADRLNVYAKCGVVTARFIPMSAVEHEFYKKCMLAETMDDLIALGKELEEMDKSPEHSSRLSDFIKKLKVDLADEELTQEEIDAEIQKQLDKIQEQRVQDIFDGAVAKSCLNNAVVVGYETVALKDVNIIPAKRYSEYVKEHQQKSWNSSTDAQVTADVREMRKSISHSVDSMVRVFESKKAAEQYKNVKISDTGLININKVHRYQFDDKIFRQAKILPNTKNHAYYILLDLSGSMSKIINDVIEQVVVIVEFFRRIQVPYKVVGFGMSVTSQLNPMKDLDLRPINPMPSIFREFKSSRECLLELMTNTQTTLEHNMSIVGLMSKIGWSLGSTPTGFAVAGSEQYAMNFFKQNQTTSNHMIVMTDGAPTDVISNSWGNRGKTTIVTDKQTKKTVISQGSADYAMINCIGKVFENRHAIKFTTISMMRSLNESNTCAFVSSRITDEMRSEWTKHGYTTLIDPNTKNKVLVAKPFSVDTDVGQITGDISEKSASYIAKAMLRNMKKVRKSRSFLNALAEILS
jgi:hypothetical protein